MAISYPLSLPSVKSPRTVSLLVRHAVALSTSPFTFAQQVQAHSGDAWGAEISLPNMARADAEEWEAWLLQLRGQYGTFLLGDTLATSPRGTAAGTPVVDGGSQTGYTLDTTGWTATQTGVLLAGDFIQIAQRLYKVTVDADADGDGDATLDIWPRLRESPADSATIITEDTVGTFRLAKSAYGIAGQSYGGVYSLNFSCVEAI